MPIIKSLLDTDFYKFTMQQVVFKKFPDVEVGYTFKNRTAGIQLDYDKFAKKIEQECSHLQKLRFKVGELGYMKSLGLFSRGHLEYLKNFRFNNDVSIGKGDNGEVEIEIYGTWLNTILWEVPLLAIISELHSKEVNPTCSKWQEGDRRLFYKVRQLNRYEPDHQLKIADFGTRRRFGREWQNHVVQIMEDNLPCGVFVGTSNVYLARKYNVKPIGTMAHEFIQAAQALVRLKDSQKYAFQTWADVYRGDLGIALSDTLGMDAFLEDFDQYFAKLFDGARHDSGSPYTWGDKLIAHYKAMGIDPMTKTAVFSDGLNFDKIIELHKEFSDKIKCSFGIGTNLTNDCGITPLQIVIKMSNCDGRPVAKISDSPGKQMCNDAEYLKYLASVFNIGGKDVFR